MKLSLNAASLFGLALFMLPLAAQENPPADQPVVEQPAAEQPAAPAVEVAPPAIPEDVLKLIADTRSPAELNDQELSKRVKKASALAKDEALPQDIRDQLTAIAEAGKGELQGRKQAEEQKRAAEEQAAQEQAAAEKAAAAQAAKDQAAAEKAVAAQAAKEQAAAEKAVAAQAAKEQAAAEKAAAAQAAQEQAAADQAAADKAAQEQAAADKAANDKATADQAAKTQAAAEQAAADQAAKDQAAMKAAADKATQDQAAADQAAKDKAAQDQAAAQAAQPAQSAAQAPVAEVAPVAPAVVAPPPPPPAPVAEAAPPPKIVLAPAPPPKEIPPPPPPPPELKPLPPAAAVAPPPPPVAAASVADAQALDNNTGNPAAEKQAKDYLADNTDLNTLTDEQLRARLDATRELMAANELSRTTERALRTKLQAEKDVLRQRIAKVEAANQAKAAQANAANPPAAVAAAPAAPGAPAKAQPAAPATTTTNNITNNTTNIITVLTPPQQVLRDRRPAERLDVSELQIRIQIFGDAQNNRGYDQPNRDYWRASVERDRAILRRRMIEERHRREAELALEGADDSFEISNEYQPSRRPRRDVFAAEIDDAEMEDVLIEPPRDFNGGINRRYKVDEIAVQPKLRNSISRIEIDTIRFGYNEAFMRDEQVGNLDGIAAIIEKIVRKYPNEVFLIEGHTDAPGSAAYNTKLSKLRAESIKKALTSYFVIPAKNLRTVGLGERFLKIPTADAEPENRRVSIARITPLLTQR